MIYTTLSIFVTTLSLPCLSAPTSSHSTLDRRDNTPVPKWMPLFHQTGIPTLTGIAVKAKDSANEEKKKSKERDDRIAECVASVGRDVFKATGGVWNIVVYRKFRGHKYAFTNEVETKDLNDATCVGLKYGVKQFKSGTVTRVKGKSKGYRYDGVFGNFTQQGKVTHFDPILVPMDISQASNPRKA